MEHKKADNTTINLKQKINELNNMIEEEKKKIKKLDSMQEEITSLNKNMNKCIELLSKSIESPTKDNMLSDMYNSNKSLYRNLTSSLDEEAEVSKKIINKLSQEKDNLIKENKKKNRGDDDASSSN